MRETNSEVKSANRVVYLLNFEWYKSCSCHSKMNQISLDNLKIWCFILQVHSPLFLGPQICFYFAMKMISTFIRLLVISDLLVFVARADPQRTQNYYQRHLPNRYGHLNNVFCVYLFMFSPYSEFWSLAWPPEPWNRDFHTSLTACLRIPSCLPLRDNRYWKMKQNKVY